MRAAVTAHRSGPGHARPLEPLPWVFLRMFTSPVASAWAVGIVLVVGA